MVNRTLKMFVVVVTTDKEERRVTFKAHSIIDAVLKAGRYTLRGEAIVAVGEEGYIR